MLTSRSGRNQPNRKIFLLLLAFGLPTGALIGTVAAHTGNGTAAHVKRTTARAQPSRAYRSRRVTNDGNSTTSSRRRLRAALDKGVEQADSLDGEAAAAVWVGGDRQPVMSGPAMTSHRLWSTSKAVVLIAALQALHNSPGTALESVMADAITRSDNCAARRMIIGLQDRLGGGTKGVEGAFERVLRTANANIERQPQAGAVEPACIGYLRDHRAGLPLDKLAVTPQFGTAEWSQYDAISFAHRLSEGGYGAAGAYLTELMKQPKGSAHELPTPQSAPEPDWGAGVAFPASWQPAWKAGWGGARDRPRHFLATQIVLLRVGHVPVAATAIFLPRVQPVNDNPGITLAPRALEILFKAARVGLEREL